MSTNSLPARNRISKLAPPSNQHDRKGSQESPITAVTRAFSILEVLASPEGPKSLAEISREAGLARSTTHRFLKALVALGFVSQDSKTSIYRATLKLFNLGSVVLAQFNITERLLPVMRRIAEQVEESVSLVFQEGGDGVLLERVEGKQGVQVFAKYRRNPLYCTAAGKAILSCFDDERLAIYSKQTPLRPRTQHTITNAAELRREIEQIRSQGFAIDNEELEIGAKCVAVPLVLTDDLLAAVSVSALAPRMTEKRMHQIAAVANKELAAAGLSSYERQKRLPALSLGKQ